MPSEYIPQVTRKLVQARARGYCEYCFSPDDYGAAGFVVEHVYPRDYGLWQGDGEVVVVESYWGGEFAIVAGFGGEASAGFWVRGDRLGGGW
jgi:hypothetical protein